MRLPFALLLCLLAVPAAAQRADRATPGWVRVRLDTSAGPIVVALDARRAPRTTANFLAYVDDKRLDDTRFYRAARRKSAPQFGFIQGGISSDARRVLPSPPLERTDVTGIRHLDATISMARNTPPDSATGNFFLTVGATPNMDRSARSYGYAAFGRVVAGMGVVKLILAQPTGGGSGAMRGQMLLRPIRIVRAVRLDGRPRPTGRPKPWLLFKPRG